MGYVSNLRSLVIFNVLFICRTNCLSPIFRTHTHSHPNVVQEIDFLFDGEHRLTGNLGLSLPDVIGTGVNCSRDPLTMCRMWEDYVNLTITSSSDSCATVEWISIHARRLEDCFVIGPEEYMYGGPESLYQYWPINQNPKNEAAYVSSDFLTRYNDFGNLIENYWLFSQGAVIHVDETNPLFVSWNTTRPGHLCFISADRHPYNKRAPLSLKYTVCTGADVKAVHQTNFFKWYEKPSGLPDETMLTRPLWSTWAQFGPNVNQEIVLDLARKVVSEGFGNSSHIEIDDKWETCYGQLEFDPAKFPDPTGMIAEIRSLNLRVTLWTHPFVNFDCDLFTTGVRDGYFIKDDKGKTAIAGWWAGGTAGAIDVNNERGAAWWVERLGALRTQYGVDAFKFDAGEVNWLPHSPNLDGNPNLAPMSYTTAYVETVAPFGGLIETRVGRMTQKHAIFTRIMDRDSHWRHDAGLKSVIPTVLLLGVLGYPFILPDMIGGSGEPSNPWPSKELYIRWVQVNVFMPAMQFSLFPWDSHYDDETIEIVKSLLQLREKYKDHILAAAALSVSDGSPINRPLWWVDPLDTETFLIDQEFILGDSILVAPIVEEGASSRDIYLPLGTYLDPLTNIEHTGPIWLRNHSVPLNILPYFIKI